MDIILRNFRTCKGFSNSNSHARGSLTQVPRISYPPPTFYFFLHRRPFFYKRSGGISKNFFKKNFGVVGAEPPGNFFLQYQVQQKVLRILKSITTFGILLKSLVSLVLFNKFPSCENILFFPESIKDRGPGAEPPGKVLQF